MKKIFAIFIFSNFIFGQVGINTDNPSSTLTLNGSYAGNFRVISNNTTLGNNDQFINVVANAVVTVTLPNTNIEPSIRGRIYTIKNTSSQNVIIRGFSAGERLRTSNGTSFQTITVAPGTSVQIIKNQNITPANRWEVIIQSSITVNETEPIKTLTFSRSISSPINANTPINSVVGIGNLSVRYNGTTSDQGFIEYSIIQPSHVTVWYKKAGNGGVGLDIWSTQAAIANTWYRMDNQGDQNRYNINPNNRDVSESIIILHNPRQVYRITSNLNGAIGADGSIPAVASSATLFVEKLD